MRRTATLAEGPLIVATDLACRNDQCLSTILWKSREAPRSVHVANPLPQASALPSSHAIARRTRRPELTGS